MPIGTVTMILANVGMQIYNNWCNGRQNEQLQQMREEFEQAARERQTERMWQLMREGQELTLQLEKEKHQQRIDELKKDVGDLLLKLARENAINNWPLNVLPIVMKNQALGNLLANKEESIALHCILAPSNCPDFNKYVYSAVEKELEQYCNLYWSSNSGHPVLFYSGAWRGNDAPTGVQIESMRTALSNLPTLLITPFFRPSDGNLVIQLRIWGVGAASNDNGMLSDLYEFEPSEKEFQREYNKQLDFASEEGLIEDLVEDLVPYLQCLIGYMADTYFWSSSGTAPVLPGLIKDGIISTDGMKYLESNSCDYYGKLLQTSEDNAENLPFEQSNLVKLYEGIAVLWKDIEWKKGVLLEIISKYNKKLFGNDCKSFNDILMNKKYHSDDLPFLTQIERHRILLPINTSNLLNDEIERLNHLEPKIYTRSSFPYNLLHIQEVQELDMESILHSFEEYCMYVKQKDLSILICLINSNEIHFHSYDDKKDVILYYDQPFNLGYRFQSIKHQRNVKALFSNGKTKQLSCGLHRIGYLIERINNTNYTY